jgi:two-component system, OmpR family, sensor histidine kinase KdpD
MVDKDSRPNPDELLAQVKAEEEQKKRGKLKIFLGYSAGVGKTFAMLEAARVQKQERDLVVAYVETHGRPETDALLEGLEVIPRRRVEYRGVTLQEMDLDAVLARRPQLALVDELAHTNVPESRHPKRYQDVEELIEAGIDVYTTLNVQHVESLRNVVMQITGIWMHEAVPDSVIDRAAEIELTDLPPDELLKRLKEGKVYVPDEAARAAAGFFREGNLIALRELAMRTAVSRVDERLRAYMQIHGIRGPWPAAERLLVCISPNAQGARLVRTARRLASQLYAEWFAVYVETPNDVRLSPDERNRLMDTLRLAERMGAKTVTIRGDSVAAAVTEYATKNHITKIVVGKTQNRWRRLFGTAAVDQIIRQSKDVDVFVATAEEKPIKQQRTPTGRLFSRWRGYLQALLLMIFATLLGQAVHSFFTPANIIMIYLLCVVVTAVFWGFGPSVLVCITSVLLWNFFFVKPHLTFAVEDTQYIFAFITLLLVSLTISYLTTRIRQQTEAAQGRESETATLYALSRTLAAVIGLESTIRAIINSTRETFGLDAVIFLPDAQNKGGLKPHADNPDIAVGEKEVAAAVWCFQHQKVVGHGTDTLPNARARYLPLSTARGTVGVMALLVTDATSRFTIQQTRLLEAYADLAAVAIERTQFAEKARSAEILETTEKLQTALLNSISHDLRTPLVSVIGVLSSLQEEGMHLDDAARRNLVQVAREEAERLNHLIANLLDVTRLEAGALKVSRQPCDVEDIIGAALEQLGSRSDKRPVRIELAEGLPFVSADFGLIVQVLVNIMENAFKYSPPGSPVEVTGRQTGQQVEIEVADRGGGVPQQDLLRIFDKFYRVQRPDSVVGTGLGLAICKGIAEAHGGSITAENRQGGGTTIRLTLPMADAASGDMEARA